jgi:hypothetical protein
MMSGSEAFLAGGDIRGFVQSAQVPEDLVASHAARRAAIRSVAADMGHYVQLELSVYLSCCKNGGFGATERSIFESLE